MVVVSKHKLVVVELESAQQANELFASGEWGLPRYSERRDRYVMVRLKGAL